LGLFAFDAGDLGFDAFNVDDFAFGFAIVRRGAVARFFDFRGRLAIFPPGEP
jgi:hypothetical protein